MLVGIREGTKGKECNKIDGTEQVGESTVPSLTL
jgi:hypothetical protein